MSAASADVDICVGNNTLIDPVVYNLWLDGYSVNEAVNILQRGGILERTGATPALLLTDTLDHYHVFSMIETLLHNPPKMSHQLMFQISPETQQMLIEKYYEFDNRMVREILGRKLSSRSRKDLDDVAEKVNVRLRSCRRQFDNVKRVFKTVEDMRGTLLNNITANFLLSEQLAEKYAAIAFITNHRFETNKKKLSYLTFEDFAFCGNHMIANWSYSSTESSEADMDVDLDRNFLMDLRELKILLDKEFLDEHKLLVCKTLRDSLLERIYIDMDNNFKNISRVLINIAYDLNHSKDARDLFVDIVEKFIEPLKQAKWTYSDLSQFLTAYTEACHKIEAIRRSCPRLLQVWERYMNTMSACILHMYHN